VTHSIPLVPYYNATIGHGVDPADTEYWNDMGRKYPSIKVKSTSGKIFVSKLTRCLKPVKVKNRFVRVSWRMVYA